MKTAHLDDWCAALFRPDMPHVVALGLLAWPRPTYTWDSPDETLISEPISLILPAALPPGLYDVVLGLYDWSTLARLPAQQDGRVSGDAVQLLTITIAE